MNSEHFEIHIESLTNRGSKIVDMGGKTCVIAKLESEYELHIHNKSTVSCEVSVRIANVHAGTWNMGKRSTLKFVKDVKTSKSLSFSNEFWHIKDDMPTDQQCIKSSITATFVPHVDCSDPMYHITTTLTVPVILCDHDV